MDADLLPPASGTPFPADILVSVRDIATRGVVAGGAVSAAPLRG
jgi:hypothetical protein